MSGPTEVPGAADNAQAEPPTGEGGPAEGGTDSPLPAKQTKQSKHSAKGLDGGSHQATPPVAKQGTQFYLKIIC